MLVGTEKSVVNNKGGVTSVLPELNFPLPAQGPACLVKIYDSDDSAFKLNDVIEVLGILGGITPGPNANDDKYVILMILFMALTRYF